MSPFRRRQHLLVGGTGSSQPDVLQQAGVEQELLLRDEGDLLIQRGEGHLSQVLPPQRDASVRHIVKVDQQLGKGRLPAAGFSHQSSEAPLWDREGDAVEDFVLFIRKPHILKADLQIVSVEMRFSFFQGRNIEQRFHLVDLVAQLGQHRHKVHGSDQRRSHGKRHAQYQRVIRQGRGAGEYQIAADRQQHQRHAGQNAGVEGHPQPAGPEPIQSKITVVFYIGLKAVIGLSVPVEDFHDFHAVDVLHDGVVHFLPGGVVVSHLAHAGAVHHAHSQHAQREGAEGKQTKLPVREEHGHKYHHRHRQIGQPFRQGVGQQKFHALNVVNEHLLPDSNALLLDRAQGLLFQLALEMEPEVFQRMIGGAMRQCQPLHIKKAVEDHA